MHNRIELGFLSSTGFEDYLHPFVYSIKKMYFLILNQGGYCEKMGVGL